MKWCRSPAVEGFLDSLGVPYRFVEKFPYADINVSKGLKNNARIITSPVDDDVVLQYAIAMQDDATFPAGIVYKNGSGYIPADFNHRLAAFSTAGLAKAGATVGAYVLDTDDEALIAVVTRSLNRLNGFQQSKEEAVEQALAILDQHPQLTQAKIAATFGIQPSAISIAKRARQVQSLLCERKIAAHKLSRTSLVELGKLSDSEPVMAVAAEVAVRRGFDTTTVKELVSTVRQQHGGENRRMAAIESFEAQIEKRSPGKIERKQSPKAAFYRALHALYGVVAKNTSLEKLHITSKAEREEAKREWDKVRVLMDKIVA